MLNEEVFLSGRDVIVNSGIYWSVTIPLEKLSWPKAFEYAVINMHPLSAVKMLWRKVKG